MELVTHLLMYMYVKAPELSMYSFPRVCHIHVRNEDASISLCSSIYMYVGE